MLQLCSGVCTYIMGCHISLCINRMLFCYLTYELSCTQSLFCFQEQVTRHQKEHDWKQRPQYFSNWLSQKTKQTAWAHAWINCCSWPNLDLMFLEKYIHKHDFLKGKGLSYSNGTVAGMHIREYPYHTCTLLCFRQQLVAIFCVELHLSVFVFQTVGRMH